MTKYVRVDQLTANQMYLLPTFVPFLKTLKEIIQSLKIKQRNIILCDIAPS